MNHMIKFGIFTVSQKSSLGQNVVNLFFFSLWRNVSHLFLRCFPVHRVERGVTLQHHPMFHPVTSFVSLVECVSAHTFTFVSMSKSQFSIEISTNYKNVSFAIFNVNLDRSVHVSRCDGPHVPSEKYTLISLMR